MTGSTFGELPAELSTPGLPTVYKYLDNMRFFAAVASEKLGEAWRRPFRHNEYYQRGALQAVLQVDLRAERALAYPLPIETDPQAAYELRAGMLVVHHTLPFSEWERQQLSTVGAYEAFEDDAERRALLARWHRWLWQPGTPDAPRKERSSTEAAILSEGCARLVDVLGPLVDEAKAQAS